ncbi:unnamed protein product, partial [Discosporangium mesarthrocarpum]
TGWRQQVTPEGDVYYEDYMTKTTSWDRPGPFTGRTPQGGEERNGVTSSSSYSPPPSERGVRASTSLERRWLAIPNPVHQTPTRDSLLTHLAEAGWSKRTSPNGRLYYANHIDKTTSWDRPTAAGE